MKKFNTYLLLGALISGTFLTSCNAVKNSNNTQRGAAAGAAAGAVGVASVFADGRTSVSAAVGFSGGNEVGGRLGVAYVFGGK